jgi:hypothetical protein
MLRNEGVQLIRHLFEAVLHARPQHKEIRETGTQFSIKVVQHLRISRPNLYQTLDKLRLCKAAGYLKHPDPLRLLPYET